MCGRFVSASPPDQIARYFDAVPDGERTLEPSYNVAPSNDVYAVLSDGGVRKLETLHWGLVPFWAKDPSVGNRMINARAETLADKPAYRRAFRKRRCIIPADGFYEWQKIPGQKHKQPMFMHRADGEPMAFAGLWEVWRPKERHRRGTPLLHDHHGPAQREGRPRARPHAGHSARHHLGSVAVSGGRRCRSAGLVPRPGAARRSSICTP